MFGGSVIRKTVMARIKKRIRDAEMEYRKKCAAMRVQFEKERADLAEKLASDITKF